MSRRRTFFPLLWIVFNYGWVPIVRTHLSSVQISLIFPHQTLRVCISIQFSSLLFTSASASSFFLYVLCSLSKTTEKIFTLHPCYVLAILFPRSWFLQSSYVCNTCCHISFVIHPEYPPQAIQPQFDSECSFYVRSRLFHASQILFFSRFSTTHFDGDPIRRVHNRKIAIKKQAKTHVFEEYKQASKLTNERMNERKVNWQKQ